MLNRLIKHFQHLHTGVFAFFLGAAGCSQLHSKEPGVTMEQISSVKTSKNTVTVTIHKKGDQHFAYTGGDGTKIDVFSVSDTGELKAIRSHSLWKDKGPARGLLTETIAGTDYLFVGNKLGNAVEVHKIEDDGTLSRVFVVEDDDSMHLGIVITLQVIHMKEASYLFVGGLEKTPGLTSFRILENGHLEHVQSMQDTEEIFTDGIIGMSIHRINNQTYLFTGGFQDSGISSFRVLESGRFENISNISDDRTMFLNGTYPVISVNMDNQHYVLAGHRHHIYYDNANFIKRKGFYYHGDGVTVFMVNGKGELIPRSVLIGDSQTVIKGQTRLDSLPMKDGRSLIAVATRDDNSIQLCYMEKTGRLLPALAFKTDFPIYYGMATAVINNQSFVFAGSVDGSIFTSYKVEEK